MSAAFQRTGKPRRQQEVTDPAAFRHTHVPAPFGSRDAELPLVHVDVLPFESDHLAASKTGLAAQQDDQLRVRFACRRFNKPLELLEVVGPRFSSGARSSLIEHGT